ncbi:MAG: dihydrofolate reductase family protein [Bacteroidota bacterium]
MSSKVTIHMVSSLDGFIARRDNSLSWFEMTSHFEEGIELTDEEIAAFLASIDCYVLGSRTYEQALAIGWPYGEKPVVVVTSRELPSDRSTVEFHHGELEQLVDEVLRPQYANIWVGGGAHLTKQFLQHGLADEIIISFLPILLGDGQLFFDFIGRELPLHLKDVTTFKTGMVEMTYEVKRG